MSTAGLTVHGLSKRFGDVVALDELTLDVPDGQFVVLVGPSGSGKSTVLRLVSGLEDPSAGRIEIHGRDVTRTSPRSRDVAMVFQDYALYPHMTCFANIAYGLKVRGVPRREIAEKVERTAALMGLDQLLERRPGTLSGGQRQRVAVARAVVRDPAVFLMDEPLSNLDARLRLSMRTELRTLQDRLGVTTVFVTHDQTEAMTMGDQVAVLRAGRLQQFAAPQVVYDAPANLFVAGFLGNPGMNFLNAEITTSTIRIGSTLLRHGPDGSRTGPVIVGIRPEDLTIIDSDGDQPSLPGHVTAIEPLGSETIIYVEVEATTPELPELQDAAADEPTLRPTTTQPRRTAIIAARVRPRLRIEVGQRLALTLIPAGVHLFDPHSHQALPTSEPRRSGSDGGLPNYATGLDAEEQQDPAATRKSD